MKQYQIEISNLPRSLLQEHERIQSDVKPHSPCLALLLEELLLMTTGIVAEISFRVPRAATNKVVYCLIFHTFLCYSSQNRDRHSKDIHSFIQYSV